MPIQLMQLILGHGDRGMGMADRVASLSVSPEKKNI